MRLHVVLLSLCLCACPPPKPQSDAGSDPDTGTWRIVLEGLPGTLLSAWESSDGVLYAVGGTSSTALVLRHDRDGWWQMDPGTSNALWWVHGFSASDVYAVGAAGVVTHFDGTRWTVEREGGDFTLFGAWGATANDLVAVGGVVNATAPRAAMVSRRSGWAEIPTTGLPPDRALFKVWGRNETDLFIVGERGLVAEGSPGAFVRQTAPTTERLTTVHGAGTEVYAVGGLQNPVMVRFEGTTWTSLAIPGSPQLLNGVAVSSSGDVAVVGLNGYLAEGHGDTFVERRALTRRGLHGLAVTHSGFVALGGELLGTFGQGVLLTNGTLQGGLVARWPFRGTSFDAGVADSGVDAGVDAGADAGFSDASADAGVDAGTDAGVDAGLLGPGDWCDSAPQLCQPGLVCWFVLGPFRSVCSGTCTASTDCGAYGAGACCKLPGPQATMPVCLPFDAGVCDAG